jgi:inhibitor of KinA sporulation pathway (predicted exonuclease)
MYIIIDLEATCWRTSNKGENEIIEIGAVLINKSYNILGEYQTFIKPARNPVLSEFCTSLTSITQKDVDRAEKFPVAFKKFIHWLAEKSKCDIKNIVFCSWGYYDKKQLKKDCAFHDVKYPFLIHRSLKHEFAKKLKHKPVGMKKALRICKIELEGTHHRALSDTRNITKIFIKEKMAEWS